MTYKGHVEEGKVVFDEPVPLAEGTRVRIEILNVENEKDNNGPGPTLTERLASVLGKAEGLPEDAAENLDHYLYGIPKK